MVVDDVVVIWSFAGSTVSILIAFFLPALFYLKLRKGSIRHDKHKMMALALLVVSVLMFVLCTYEAFLNASHKFSKKGRAAAGGGDGAGL